MWSLDASRLRLSKVRAEPTRLESSRYSQLILHNFHEYDQFNHSYSWHIIIGYSYHVGLLTCIFCCTRDFPRSSALIVFNLLLSHHSLSSIMAMESLSLTIVLSASPPLQTHSKTPQSTISALKSSIHPVKDLRLLKRAHPSNESPFQNPRTLSKTCLSLALCNLFSGLPSFAAETVAAASSPASEKINLEEILVSIDDFNNRNPFFVAGCAFVWLIGIPVAEYYLKKYKYIFAIDAFRKLRDDPTVQLLDIRDIKSVAALGSPSLNYMNKGVVQVEFDAADEAAFVKKVKESFKDPENTSICILDNSDGNSFKVAELLFKNGFKEAFAIKGGVRGKKGWVAIQEELLPRSVHMKPTKKGKASKGFGTNGTVNQHKNDNSKELVSSPPSLQKEDPQIISNGDLTNSTVSVPLENEKVVRHSSSPYSNYPDMKPPSSPTPSKPEL